MVIHHVFSFASVRRLADGAQQGAFTRMFDTALRHLSRFWCGLHGHLIMMHYEPNRLSLECALCGYRSEGWEVGPPMMARRQANNPQARPDRRRAIRSLPSRARLAS